MPHRDSIGTDELKTLWLSDSDRIREANKAYHLICAQKDKTRQEAIKAEVSRLNEISRLKYAKQIRFDFAEPGEDWGSLT